MFTSNRRLLLIAVNHSPDLWRRSTFYCSRSFTVKKNMLLYDFFFLSVGELLFMENSERIGNIELRSFSYFDIGLMIGFMVHKITRTLLLNNLLISDIDNR